MVFSSSGPKTRPRSPPKPSDHQAKQQLHSTMRSLGRLAAASPASASCYPFLASSSNAFSTFSGAGGGGGGRGRGRGAGAPPSPPPGPLGKPQYELDRADDDTGPPLPPGPLGRPQYELDRADDDGAGSAPSGLGHGQVQPPVFRSFSWSSSVNPPLPPPTAAFGRGRGSLPPPPPSSRPPSPPAAAGRGRGRGGVPSASPPDPDGPKKPIFFRREGHAPDQFVDQGGEMKASEGAPLPFGLSFGLPHGAFGRGKPTGPAAPRPTAPQENRHLRPRSPPDHVPRGGSGRARPAISPPRMLDREKATKNAMDILSGGGRGQTGRGLRGRGERGGMAWRGRGGRFGGRGRARDPDEYYGTGLFLGDNADGEKLAKRMGEENMAQLKEAFEEMSGRVLPSPMEDAYLEALHTNYSFEFEPEYHMEFNNNPDIDENPPLSLSEALEKMKPFLMQYEGIGSQEEWEEVVKETMERAPVLKELVDFYSGPDRVTAKQQHQELERVAKTLPESVPSSVKRFTDRAILSLQ
ncbi:hypothetical protein Taro_028088, partial [Colocasia esculenta]|nr:hypothetical protein [Colocasia esculenta]